MPLPIPPYQGLQIGPTGDKGRREFFSGTEGFEAGFEDFDDEFFRGRGAATVQGLRAGVFRHGQPLFDEPQEGEARTFQLARGEAPQALQLVEGVWGFAGDLLEQFIVQNTAWWSVGV